MSSHSRALATLLALLFPLSMSAADRAYLVRDLPGVTVKDSMDWGPIFWTTIGNTTWFAGLTEPRTLDIFKTDGTTEGTVRVTHGAGTTDREEPTLTFLGVLGEKIIYGGRNTSGEGVFALDTNGGEPVRLAAINLHYLTNGVVLGGTLYFSARTATVNEIDLWRTDGTPAGTSVVDLRPGPGGPFDPARDSSLFPAGDSIYFFGVTSQGGGLHRTDGTSANTTLVLALPETSLTNDTSRVFAFGNRLLFHLAARGERKAGLWSTDGTAPVMIAEMPRFTPFEIIGGKLWFEATNAIWTTDGTVAGTQKTDVLAEQNVSSIIGGHAVGDQFYFFGSSFNGTWVYKLYVTHGTAASTREVMEVEHNGTLSTGEGFVIGDRFYFRHDDGIHDNEIWMTDGTTTQLLTDINPGYRRSFDLLHGYARPDGKFLFPAVEYNTGREPWITDGTAAGTRLLANLAAEDPTHGSSPRSLHASGERVFFTATLSGGQAIGVSDGTSSGTTASLTDFGWTIDSTAAANGRYFYSLTMADPFGLFATDGTAAGTSSIYEGSPTPVPLGSGVLFKGKDAIWFSDGTIAGTRVLQITENVAPPPRIFAAGDHAWFSHSQKLWKTDGTDAGTVEIEPADAVNSAFYSLIRAGTSVYLLEFSSSASGTRLWRSDGTSAGTRVVKVLSSGGAEFVGATEQLVYFSHAGKLHRSDGTDAGTVELPVSSPCYATASALGDSLIIASSGINKAITVWRTDGTVEGTTQLVTTNILRNDPFQCPSMATKDDVVYFSGWDSAHGWELWVTDGSVAGTRLFADIYPGQTGSDPHELTVAGDRMFFSADSPWRGRELWAVGESPTTRRRAVGR